MPHVHTPEELQAEQEKRVAEWERMDPRGKLSKLKNLAEEFRKVSDDKDSVDKLADETRAMFPTITAIEWQAK